MCFTCSFCCFGHFPYCIIPFLEGSHPLPDQLPREHTGPHLMQGSISLLFDPSVQHYTTIIDATSAHHNLRLDINSSYLTTFACQFGRYRSTRVPFAVTPAGDMLQKKFNEILKCLQNVFGIVMTF